MTNSRKHIHYYSYSDFLINRFGQRVQKLAINAGFTCPNRDGTLSTKGCSYCNNDAFNPSYCNPAKSIATQLEEGIEFHQKRYRRAKEYLAYFQAFTNTYKNIDELEEIYHQALSHPKVVGLVIGTRPDCIDNEKINLLSELSNKYFISVEYGIESCYNETLKTINRGHTFEQTVKAIEMTANKGIHIGSHVIFGLPNETKQMMLDEAKILSSLPIDSIKFHQLQIFKDTPLYDDFINNQLNYKQFAIDEYVDFIIDFVELLRPNISIERFVSEAPPRYLATKPWVSIRSDQIQLLINKKFEERKTFQGRLYKGN